MKFTRYIVIREYPSTNSRAVYVGGKDRLTQFNSLEFPNKLGKFFDRKGLAFKKAEELNNKAKEMGMTDCCRYSVSKVKIEIEEGIESK